jgi:hypothetical protein
LNGEPNAAERYFGRGVVGGGNGDAAVVEEIEEAERFFRLPSVFIPYVKDKIKIGSVFYIMYDKTEGESAC